VRKVSYVVKNTAYVFSKGAYVAKHEKMNPFNETRHFKPADKVIFKPGKEQIEFKFETGKIIHSPIINETFGIEICAEHGNLKKLLAETPHKSPPLIQFLLSNIIKLERLSIVSPYVVHIDPAYKIQLITDIDKDKVQISLDSCDILSKKFSLTPIEPENSYMDFSTIDFSKVEEDEEDEEDEEATVISTVTILKNSNISSKATVVPSVSDASSPSVQTTTKENGALLSQDQDHQDPALESREKVLKSNLDDTGVKTRYSF
jgi:hypothetical protein